MRERNEKRVGEKGRDKGIRDGRERKEKGKKKRENKRRE